MRAPISAKEAGRCLVYDPESGTLTRRIDSTSHNGAVAAKAGDAAGYINDRGYVCVSVMGKEYRAHRLAWAIYYGSWPAANVQIDHINGIRSDNRIVNLRLATNRQNSQNERQARTTNRTGFLGVSRHRDGRFRARIVVDGKERSLGIHGTARKAHAAYVQAKRLVHPYSTI